MGQETETSLGAPRRLCASSQRGTHRPKTHLGQLQGGTAGKDEEEGRVTNLRLRSRLRSLPAAIIADDSGRSSASNPRRPPSSLDGTRSF